MIGEISYVVLPGGAPNSDENSRSRTRMPVTAIGGATAESDDAYDTNISEKNS